MHYQSYTFPNGLRIIHLPTHSSVSYCGFGVNCGTRDEASGEFGMAHFVEHMLFKGTEKRRSWHILNRMESVGGELNAFTTKEETMVYSIFPERHIERAVELLSDLVCNSQFPEGEMEKELDVILDEINSYKDNPSELIYDEFENHLFEGHQIGHYILGDEEQLELFTPEWGLRFLQTQYQPANMVFFSMGATDFKKIVRLLDKYMESRPALSNPHQRVKPENYTPFGITRKMETFQSHAVIGSRAFAMHDDRRPALVLLNNILGGPGMNSRLNLMLRERHGYVYNVESAYTAYTDTGVFSIYFGTDPKNMDKCLNLVHKELRRFCDQSLTSLQLHSAKKQLMGQMEVGTDNFENTALAMAKSFLHFNTFHSMDEAKEMIEAVTTSQMLEVANEVFEEKNLSRLIFN